MTDASAIGTWVLAAGVVISILLNFRKLSGRPEQREIQQPLEVRASAEYAPRTHEHPQYITRDDCKAMHTEARAATQQDRHAATAQFEGVQRQLDHLRAEIKQDLADHNKQAIERSDAIHGRISALIPQIATAQSRIDDHLEDHRRKGA